MYLQNWRRFETFNFWNLKSSKSNLVINPLYFPEYRNMMFCCFVVCDYPVSLVNFWEIYTLYTLLYTRYTRYYIHVIIYTLLYTRYYIHVIIYTLFYTRYWTNISQIHSSNRFYMFSLLTENHFTFSSLPVKPIVLAPLILAICPTKEPTAPAAPDTTTVSPDLGYRIQDK